MESLIFNPCGEFRWSPEDQVSQIHFPLFHVGGPGIFPDHLRSVQMLKREWGAGSNRKLLHLFITSKSATGFLSLQWKTCLWAELQPWCLSLQWKTCPWAENTWWWYCLCNSVYLAWKTIPLPSGSLVTLCSLYRSLPSLFTRPESFKLDYHKDVTIEYLVPCQNGHWLFYSILFKYICMYVY